MKYIKLLLIALINTIILVLIFETKGRMLKTLLPFVIILAAGYVVWTFILVLKEKDENTKEEKDEQ